MQCTDKQRTRRDATKQTSSCRSWAGGTWSQVWMFFTISQEEQHDCGLQHMFHDGPEGRGESVSRSNLSNESYLHSTLESLSPSGGQELQGINFKLQECQRHKKYASSLCSLKPYVQPTVKNLGGRQEVTFKGSCTFLSPPSLASETSLYDGVDQVGPSGLQLVPFPGLPSAVF